MLCFGPKVVALIEISTGSLINEQTFSQQCRQEPGISVTFDMSNGVMCLEPEKIQTHRTTFTKSDYDKKTQISIPVKTDKYTATPQTQMPGTQER